MAHLGRALQLFALVLLPAALLYGLFAKNDPAAVGRELVALAVGATAFLLGSWMLGRGGGGGAGSGAGDA